ncbi:tRNA A64-2'-O-ribosylphosphate transferase [Trichoderma aethiopicum]
MPDDDDLFAHQPSISSLLTQLRRSTLTPRNRLQSIHADASFVAHVASAFPTYPPSSTSSSEAGAKTSEKDANKKKTRLRKNRPLVANERCGSWYIPPDKKDGSAYFKSTDGHERAWKFSTRRLNLHLIDLIEENDGIIIVDSTRRGKRMPDALSTTIPIWCTVLNLALLPSHPLSPKLFLPPYLPASTHAQITALIPSFLSSLKELNLVLPTSLTKPLRPLWITQDSTLPPPPPDSDADDDDETGDEEEEDRGVIFQDYRPVICCTASRRVVGSEVDEGGYIQGAADDTENWAMGLTPDVFWANAQTLLSASEAELPDLIVKLVQEAKVARTAPSGDGAEDQASLARKQLTPYISVRPLSPLDFSSSPPPSTTPLSTSEETKVKASSNECLILLTETQTPKESWLLSPTLLRVGLGKHKTASRNLRLALPEICSFAAQFLAANKQPLDDAVEDDDGKQQQQQKPPQIVVACDSGKDLSVGVALALSCYLFDDKGCVRVPDGSVSFTKTLVKMRLGAVMTAYPEANPSRSTLQSVNSFLMDWRS